MDRAVISPLLNALVGELASALSREARLIHGVDDELDNLKRMFSKIQFLLADADERQIAEGAVKEWLAELRNIAYEADDVLDEFGYEALRRKLMEADGTIKQVRKFFLSCCLLKPILFRRDVAHRIKEINKKVDRISRDGERFRLKKGDGEIRRIQDTEQRPPSSSVIAKNSRSDFVGRDDDIKQIMNMLISDEHASGGGKDVSVISIVGMGGLGKTTLAQLVYNDDNVKKHFQLRGWVFVSEVFDISRVTGATIESVTGSIESVTRGVRENRALATLDSRQCRLKDILTAKRFLIVLDDVWNIEHSDWEKLRAPLSFGARGSKIIVTTRDAATSRAVNADHIYRLNLLSDDDCLSLFKRHAFAGDQNSDACSELMTIGQDLVENRCQGLPLAVKAVGGLLSCRREINFWRSILHSQLWSSMEGEIKVMKVLRVSYHHLPLQIKQCFAFCSIFPKYHEFEKDTLVKLWMAQGFIDPGPGTRTLEEIGSAYFDFLLSWSFFQVGSRPGYKNQILYRMHDCIHDLAMSVSTEECFRYEYENGKPTLSLEEGHRHLSFIMDMDTKTEEFRYFYKCKGSRTFILQHSWLNVCDKEPILSGIIANLRCLRLLILKNSWLTMLPDSISNLKHLRYLDLSWTKITELPESVSSLYNLQTLDLSDCIRLRQLPKETRKLINLRHLNLDGCWSLEDMPPEIGRLTCLQTLPRFIVGRKRGCGIRELKGLTALKGVLWIKGLHNVPNAKEAKEANLKDKPNIKELQLTWHGGEEYAGDMNSNKDRPSLEELGKILEAFQPHTNIKSLSIRGYEGMNYPGWLLYTVLPNLITLEFFHCTNCNSIPPLGRFHMLENLSIRGNFNLEEWCEPEEGEFPSLHSLDIYGCHKLTKMPNYFSTLKYLNLHACYQLACLPKSPSLEKLYLSNSNEILLRQVSLLTSLSTLRIENFKGLKSLPGDMLQPLINLKELAIGMCENLVSLPEEKEGGLPPTLRLLSITRCGNFKSLTGSLSSLTCLLNLTIENCPELLSLPKKGLPTSLQNLSIRGCSKLGIRCQEGGEEWAKISHIPNKDVLTV